MPKSWSEKRERPYEHIKEGLQEHGNSKALQGGERGRTYAQLYEEAKAHNLKGRSSMTKAELERRLNH